MGAGYSVDHRHPIEELRSKDEEDSEVRKVVYHKRVKRSSRDSLWNQLVAPSVSTFLASSEAYELFVSYVREVKTMDPTVMAI